MESRIVGLISGVSGHSNVLSGIEGKSQTPQLHQKVHTNDQITTDSHSTLELLIDNRALVGLGENTTLLIKKRETPNSIIVQLKAGHIKLAMETYSASPSPTLIVMTPQSIAKMAGGLVFIAVPPQTHHPQQEMKKMGETPSLQEEIFLVKEGHLSITANHLENSTIQVTADEIVKVGQQIQKETAERIRLRGVEFPLWASQQHIITPNQGMEHLLLEETQQAHHLATTLISKDQGSHHHDIDESLWVASLPLTNGPQTGSLLSGGTGQLNPGNGLHARLFNHTGNDSKWEAGFHGSEPHEPNPYYIIIDNFKISGALAVSGQVFNPDSVSSRLLTPTLPAPTFPFGGNLAGSIKGPVLSPTLPLGTANQLNIIAK